ncbi:MAG TPA: cytochrome c3 family protein [Pirellulales bacterium]|jgi:predicted CXXCH cytochrome family protein
MNDSAKPSIPLKAVVAALVALLIGGGWLLWPDSPQSRLARSADNLPELLPQPRQDGEFITSQGCRGCHAEQFASWHATYHRTMTQPATPETVKADFDDVTLELGNHEYRLSQVGNEFFVEMPNPDASSEADSQAVAARIKQRVAMTTGSHRFQYIWLANGPDSLFKSIPFAYLIEDRRWVPVGDATLEPPAVPGSTPSIQPAVFWNDDCSRCHAVAPLPNLHADLKGADTRVAELGIACEACHGPGAAHAARHRTGVASELADKSSGLANASDPTIVTPTNGDHRVSAQICGQCHSVFTYKETGNQKLGSGARYRAGDDLTLDRYIVRPLAREPDPLAREAIAEFFRDDGGGIGGQRHEFWDDGTPRIAGREYNALLETACYLRGSMTCVSCHSMHDSDPNDQLAAQMDGNQACFQCHAEYRDRVAEHTHHDVNSSGSACVNCHMPNTSYTQLTFTRSHRVDSPSVASDLAGRPNACVLCHLDQTLSWAAQHLASWYGQAVPALDEAQSSLAVAVIYALRGDACQRALIAWHARWEPARAVSGATWIAPLVSELLVDPYAAVRYQAARTLKTLPSFENFSYDFIAPEETRVMRKQQAIRQWEQRGAAAADRHGPRVLLDADGAVMFDGLRRLLNQRDDRPMRCAN